MSSLRYKAGLGGFYGNGAGSVTLGSLPAFLPADTSDVVVTLDGDQWASSLTTSDGTREVNDTEKAALRLLWEALAVLQAPSPKYAVNADGVFQGAVQDLTGLTEVPSAPPTADYRWANGQWTLPIDLAALKDDLLNVVDRTAGAARARYITVAPGQEATYVTKAQEASAYLADPTGDVPPYVAAEAAATGMTALEAATLINQTAIAWNGELGPKVEQLRRAGNIAVAAATTPADAQAAADNFVSQLEAV